MVAGEEFPSPPKSRHYLIGNQKRSGAVTPFPKGPERPLRPNFHSRRPLNDRLDHDCRDFLVILKLLQLLYIWHLLHGRPPPVETASKKPGRSQTRRTGGVAMVAVPESNERLPPPLPLELPKLVRDPQRRLDSRRAVVGEEDAPECLPRQLPDDLPRQLDRRRVCRPEKRCVRHSLELRAESTGEASE